MAIKSFIEEIDARWEPVGGEPIALRVIGSAALMLQSDYARGTKDGDVLESPDDEPAVKEQLERLAGRDTELHRRHRVYIDVVARAILFLPQTAAFVPIPFELKNFRLEALELHDVAVSKLKRFRQDDLNDIRAMADRDLLKHARLVERFQAAVDWFSVDARAEDLPRYLRNLHTVERDILALPPTPIDLPEA